MFYNLINTMKRRLILELQDSFSRHPVYGPQIVPYIQNKFAFDERPQMGIVVKGSSANKVRLAADDFKGTMISYVMLGYVGAPAHPLEWVREDENVVEQNGNRMPIAPGVYFIEILTVPENVNSPGTFAVDPLITVTDEPVIRFISGIEHEGQLQNVPVPKTLRLWLNGRVELARDTDYTVDPKTGAIEFTGNYQQDDTVTASYRYAAPSMGPINWYWNVADMNTLPGVVLAFGKRGKAGDKVAVVVLPDRAETASVYGGRFDLSFDLDVIVAGDANAAEEITDIALMALLSEKRSKLSFDGIEVDDVSMGGEAEEAYDETADIMYYTTSLSVQMQVEWESHIPLPLTISRVSPVGAAPGLAGANAQALKAAVGEIMFQTVPVNMYRNADHERIK